MRWKSALGIFAAVGSVLTFFLYRRRRVDVRTLGAVSDNWIAEHASDRTE